MKNPVAQIGKVVIELATHIIKILNLLGQTIYWIVVGPFKRKPAKVENIANQTNFIGVKSLIIVFFVTFFTGIVIAM